jgi:hypothetical protein
MHTLNKIFGDLILSLNEPLVSILLSGDLLQWLVELGGGVQIKPKTGTIHIWLSEPLSRD